MSRNRFRSDLPQDRKYITISLPIALNDTSGIVEACLEGLNHIFRDGFEYNYGEGRMIFPDALDNASRTVITGEGGKSPSRFKHVILSERGLRRLTPVELERLNMFPDDHTKLEGVTDAKRAFFMGNALVVGVVEKIGSKLYKQIKYVK